MLENIIVIFGYSKKSFTRLAMYKIENILNTIICGDALTKLIKLPTESIDCCITSPPYWGLRDYGTARWEGGKADCKHARLGKSKNTNIGQKNEGALSGDGIYKDICLKCGARRIDSQLGLEKTPKEYISKMVEIFREVKRVLKKEGTLWLNLGDSYWGGGFGTSPGGNEDFANRYPKQASNKGTFNHETRQKLGALKKGDFLKPKDLVGIPWRVAFALQSKGWYLRQDIIWAKPNPMPESVTDRCTKSHEYIFLLAKNQKYYFDYKAIQEEATGYDGRKDTFYKGGNKDMSGGAHERWPSRGFRTKEQLPDNQHHGQTIETYPMRNKRSVWTITTKPFKGAHFATFPEDLIRPCILAGCPRGGAVLDPFSGSGTTGLVAKQLNRNYVLIDLNPEYCKMAEKRLANTRGTLL